MRILEPVFNKLPHGFSADFPPLYVGRSQQIIFEYASPHPPKLAENQARKSAGPIIEHRFLVCGAKTAIFSISYHRLCGNTVGGKHLFVIINHEIKKDRGVIREIALLVPKNSLCSYKYRAADFYIHHVTQRARPGNRFAGKNNAVSGD